MADQLDWAMVVKMGFEMVDEKVGAWVVSWAVSSVASTAVGLVA